MRRTLGVVLAVAALGAAAVAVRSVEAGRLSKSRAEAARAATAARQQATEALRRQLESLTIDASAAAGLQPLHKMLGLLQRHGIDDQIGATVKDFFANELTWDPYRKKFKVYGLSIEGERLQVVDGIGAKDFDARELVKQTREKGRHAATVMGKDWPYAAAAAQVVVSGLSRPIVLVLARPFDESLLQETAERAGGALLLSNGKSMLAKSGSDAELGVLASAVGHETDSEPFVASDGSWATAAAPLAPNLWLWVHAPALAAARDSAASATTTKAIVWAVALALAGVALFLGLRRQAPPTTASQAPLPATAVGLAPAVSSDLPPAAPLPSSAPDVSAFGSTLAAGAPVPGRPSNGVPFGRYLLLERLGEGGMSQVYTAVTFGAEGFRRKFVVKRLRPELTGDAAVVAQFIDEANLASSLVHSNIVPVFDFGKQGEEYFMATEYILGRDLGRIVRRMAEVERHYLPVGLALYCMQETLKALEYAHTKSGEGGQRLGLVHRDVSPNNVLVSGRGEVKLFDFGIVKAEGRVTRTEHGVVKGNVSFMSPEQARGVDIDARADLFSLGLVLFYCLTGEVLYQGATTYELLLKAAGGPGPDERARIAALPAPAASIVARALEVDPSRRYQSAGEFAAAIAPHVRAASNELAEAMQRLFAEEFNQEEKRFAAAFLAAAVVPGTPPQATSRRS